MSIYAAISFYLVHSYLYYELDTSIISDAAFDDVCRFLLDNYSVVVTSHHPHKHLIDKDALKASTGYGIVYPEIAKRAAYLLIKGRK